MKHDATQAHTPMKLELLVTTPCSICEQARDIWHQVAEQERVFLHVVDVADPQGEAIMARLALKIVPAIVVDDALKGVGVQSLDEARQILNAGRPAG